MEIEKKFLLDKEIFVDNGIGEIFCNIKSVKYISQYYISKKPEIRLRDADKTVYDKSFDGTCTTRHSRKITVTRKTDYALCRDEKTKVLSEVEYNNWLGFKLYPVIYKTRYTLNSGEEIDVFDDLDLCIMEKEFDSVDEAKEYKPILNNYLIRNVTGEDEYYNFEIAKRIGD